MPRRMSLDLALPLLPSVQRYCSAGIKARSPPEIIQHPVILDRKEILLHPLLGIIERTLRQKSDHCIIASVYTAY